MSKLLPFNQLKAVDARAAIATIRHDSNAGNLPKARKLAATLLDGNWDEATPYELEGACMLIEQKLDEADIR